MSYREELINSIERNFLFSKKPINRLKYKSINNKNNNLDKIEQINNLKKQIDSIHNCNLKNKSKNLILGDGNIESPIMIVGEAPGAEEEKTKKTDAQFNINFDAIYVCKYFAHRFTYNHK